MTSAGKKTGNFLNYSHHVNDKVIKTFSGDYILIMKVEGQAMETASVGFRDGCSIHLEAAYRSVKGHSIWTHTVRRLEPLIDDSYFENEACRKYNDSYVKSFGRSFVNENYISLVFSKRQITTSRKASAADLEALEEIELIENRFLSTLTDYGCSVLSRSKCGKFSEAISFLRYLSSHQQENIVYPVHKSINQVVSNTETVIGSGGIQISNGDESRFVKMLELGDYPSTIEAGEFDELLTLPCEMVLTQSFTPCTRLKSSELMRIQVAHLEMTGDKGKTQLEEITQAGGAMDIVDSGEMVMGNYCFTLEVYSDPDYSDDGQAYENASANGKRAYGVLTELGYSPSYCGCNDGGWFSRFPGMGSDRTQLDIISSDNFADFASMGGVNKGKADGNPWGPYWTAMLTSSGYPHKLNLHIDSDKSNQYGSLIPSSTAVLGPTGTGKSVFVQHLFAQARKYDPMSVMLDKDLGCKKAITARGGLYLEMKNNQRTGLAPFQWEPTGSNLLFLDRLIAAAAGGLTRSEEIGVSRAIRSVMQLDKRNRSVSALMQNLTDGDNYDTSVKARLSQWCRDDGNGMAGPYWWVFDNEADTFDVDGNRDIGIDVTEFLNDEKVGGIVTSILLQKISGMIGNGRFILGVEEFANVLKHDVIAEAIENQLQTIRKKDGMVIMVSTSPSDVLKSKIASAVVEQSANKVFFSNSDGRKEDYCDGFGLTEDEWRLVKSFEPQSRIFLHKQVKSNVLQLALDGVEGCEVVGL